MKLLYLDCRQGVSGDMLTAALVNLLDARAELEKGLAGLNLDCFNLSYPKRRRGGVETVAVEVEVHKNAYHFDDISAVTSFINETALPANTRQKAIEVFTTLAEGEAGAHDTAAGYTRFHEVGDVDAVVDVVGTLLLVDLINPDEIIASPVRLGYGTVEAVHGPLPVPAPATAEILSGVPVFGGDVEGEFATPTGAALIKTLADGFGPMPEMTVKATGYGPGAANPSAFPNVLVAYAGDVSDDVGEAVGVVEANVDDTTGEELSHAARLLLEAGALDVFVTPVYMKKGRPGSLITVIAKPEEIEALSRVLLKHTSTFGVRFRTDARYVLPREIIEVDTEYGPGAVKVGRPPDGGTKLQPEYESAAKLAAETRRPLSEIYEALTAAARKKLSK